jgi:DNA polymerase-3 subunit alpha
VSEFVHLHAHTEYSLLDGAIHCKALGARAKALGMRAVALTDHGNMFGAITHYQSCKAAGIAPILGCELNVVREGGDARPGEEMPLDHLVVLAESAQGYENLLAVVSRGHVEPAGGAAPSVRLETLVEHAAGLVVLTGCMGGWLAQRILHGGEDAGRRALADLRDRLPPRSLYVELQDHGLPEQPVLNELSTKLARELALPLVATNDCHFLEKQDGEAQLYLGCIATASSFAEASAAHHGSFEAYLKSPAEMAQLFRHEPAALAATLEIAERTSTLALRLGEPMLPTFPVPAGHDAVSYFREVARDGLARRIATARAAGRALDEARYAERLEGELDVIARMGFAGYFLIVWDFIRFARETGIPVGPGRGSGAGSLVAYAMRITDLDPIEHHLLFERFLNPERVSMPDFDIDFCMDRRDEVIRYVAERYGATSVGQIATFHELRARSVIKDVARAMGLAASDGQRIANLVPPKGPGQMCTIAEALEAEPKLKAMRDSDATVRALLATAQRLEGLTRHAGMHAAGVVISEGPLWRHVPCFKNGEHLVAQYAKDEVEAAGLVKFDFLGLKTLTVIDVAARLIDARPDRAGTGRFDAAALPLDDAETYALLQSGETTGVFQLESSGMQKLFKDLRPDCFEDIVAAVALYRPGPLGSGMVKDFVDCKHGRKPIARMHARVDELLRSTYGVIVYQEQVMQIAQRLSGYSLGGADLLRRAMGKKKPEEMAKQKATFVSGAVASDVKREDAERIFGLLEYFAGYGFNRSHSAAYALLTYQTAFLKAHYPVEFLCALLTADRDRTEKVVRIIAEGRAWGVEILPPEINESNIDFTVVYETTGPERRGEGGGERGRGAEGAGRRRQKHRWRDPLRPKIRFGLGAVRGLGEAALGALLEARADGPFADLYDLSERVDARKLNKAVLEATVACGALDGVLARRGVSRASAFASIDRALERGRTASRDRERGQIGLFGRLAPAARESASPGDAYLASEPWDLAETLRREKQALGFYVSGHPLDRYGVEIGRLDVVAVASLWEREPWAQVRVAGTVEGYRERTFRSAGPPGKGSSGGGKIAFFSLEDATGAVDVKVRDRQLEQAGAALGSGEPVLVSGKLQFPMVEEGEESSETGPRTPMLLLDEAVLLSEAVRAETKRVSIRLRASETGEREIARLGDLLRACPGGCPVELVLETEEGAAATLHLGALRVEPSDAMLSGLERLFGGCVAELR